VVVKCNITLLVFITSLLVSGISSVTKPKGSELVKLATINYKDALDKCEREKFDT